MMCNSFGKEFTEYEYVIENLAIRRAPKKLLDVALLQQQKVEKLSVVSIGPVTAVEDAPQEEDSYLLPEAHHKNKSVGSCNPNSPYYNPCFFRYPPVKKPCAACKTYYAETNSELDDSIIRHILNPHLMHDETRSVKMQILIFSSKVSADIHTVNVEDDVDRSLQEIPTEIKQTIDALKVAKPLHLTSEFPTRNHRSLIRSVSTTSCDKETFCNFLDSKLAGDVAEHVTKEKEEKLPKSTRLKKETLTS
ncbi:hypothetical protein NQ314_004616 [Rhamnusium bicolor]|uniref:Uncharacterized protein n=1 Tax=Rhamnusium bicolor TaxID=1586634 RepID=A0AAV8ZKN6_9CUCU|nr:hypothetical protein NQ314_004616 [Rhamnusium bicolor]